MAYTTSGDNYHNRPTGGASRSDQLRVRVGRHVSLISVGLSAVFLLSLIALVFYAPHPTNLLSHDGSISPLSNYAAQPTPAIDALDKALPTWKAISSPSPLYQLHTHELATIPASYSAREHGLGGREDVLTFGRFGSPGLYVKLSIYRTGDEAPRTSTFFVDMVRRSAEWGFSISGLSLPVAEETKFGPVEIVDAQLNSEDIERSCQAFRLKASENDKSYQISGWMCDSVPLEPLEIACFLDHLSITETVKDGALIGLFSKANEHRRSECGGIPTPVPPQAS